MKTDLNYCIVLSSEQLGYLAGSKYGIDRMKILHRLIEATVLKETEYAMKGFSTTLHVGQAILSEVDLSCKTGYDKKTISRVLDRMNQLGIIVSTQGNWTSVHTLKCISAWMQDGRRTDNPFYVRMKDRRDETENTSGIPEDTSRILPVSSQENTDSRVKENIPYPKDRGRDEAMANEMPFEAVFFPSDDMPFIPNEGEVLFPSSSFSPVPPFQQPAAGEEPGEDVPADSQA